MPITKTPDGGYSVAVCVRRQRLHRRLPPGSSAGDAKRLESELRLAAERLAKDKRQAALPGDPQLSQIMADYVTESKHLRSPETAAHHAQRIGPWVAKYRASQARQCAAHIVKDMRGQYADATINRSLGCLKRGLKLAWESGQVADDYSTHVKRLTEHNQREIYLDMPEVQSIAQHASPQVRAAIWIALLTGCRRGEVLAIKAEDIGTDTILIRAGNTKTLKTRTIPIIPAVRPWLEQLPLTINYEGLKSGFRRARIKAERPEFNFHDLRHSCATILLSLETPLDVVRDILGHTTIKTTERYAHVLVHRQRSALEKLGDLHQAFTPDVKKAA